MTRSTRPLWPRLAVLSLSLCAALVASAQSGPSGRPGPSGPAGPSGSPGHSSPPGHASPPGAPRPHQWYDGAHGHAHYYPTPGWPVRTVPPRSNVVVWGGANYRFHEGVWYSPGARGWVVVRPPFGVVINDLPLFRTAVVIGGLTYLYANGVYYRERGEGGYEVVPPPVGPSAPAAPAPNKTFVYPSRGQTAERQATDEYECHRWATTQAGFDPTLAATGQQAPVAADPARRDDYQRARTACLEGRGYTVR